MFAVRHNLDYQLTNRKDKMIPESMHLPIASLIKRLDKSVPLSMASLMSSVPGLTGNALTIAARHKYIENLAQVGMPARYGATNLGRERYSIPIEGIGRTPARTYVKSGTYDGADLRPFVGRQGANDAFLLKSFGFGT